MNNYRAIGVLGSFSILDGVSVAAFAKSIISALCNAFTGGSDV
jgi:hypothetical protein